MNPQPFDWIFAGFIVAALVLGFVMGCVGLGVLLLIVELFPV